MILNLRTDRAALSQEDAADFLAQFAARLEWIANSGRLMNESESVESEPAQSQES